MTITNLTSPVKAYKNIPEDPGKIINTLDYESFSQLAMETPPDSSGQVSSGLFNNPGIRFWDKGNRDVNIPYYYYPPSQVLDSLLWEGAVIYD